MGKKPGETGKTAAKARLKHLKPGEPGFLRPRVPSDPDFEAFLTSQGYYPLFSPETKRRLFRHLRHLDTARSVEDEIAALERRAALTQYSYVHRAKRRLSVAEREKLAGEFLVEAERFRTVLDKLVFHSLIADPNNVEAPLPRGSGIHVLRHSLRDLQAAIDDLELQVAAVLGLDLPDEYWQPDQNKPGNAENVARSSFIDTCVRVWLRNGGANILTYRVKALDQDDDGSQEEFDTGLWPFVRDATTDIFTGEFLTPITLDGLAKHLQRHMERILRTPSDAACLPGDSGMNEWGARKGHERTRDALGSVSVKDAFAVASLRMVLNDLKKR